MSLPAAFPGTPPHRPNPSQGLGGFPRLEESLSPASDSSLCASKCPFGVSVLTWVLTHWTSPTDSWAGGPGWPPQSPSCQNPGCSLEVCGVSRSLRKCVLGAWGLLWLPRPGLAPRSPPPMPLGSPGTGTYIRLPSTPFSSWGRLERAGGGWHRKGEATAGFPRAEPLPSARLQGVVCPPPCVSWRYPRRAGVQARGQGRTAGPAPTAGLRRGQREGGPSREPASLNPGCNPWPPSESVSVHGGWGAPTVSAAAPVYH